MVSDYLHSKMIEWRHSLHQMPEFGFETYDTAAFVVSRLLEIGVTEIETAIGGSGVVATLRNGNSNRAIALRADMDALMIREKNDISYKSLRPGFMHACGHDGHTTTLIGVAEVLHKEGGFDGIVHLIFQPAEEWGKGAQAMIDDGIIIQFPFEEIWGFHNMPGVPIGHFQTCPGAIMAAEDNFEIKLNGKGGHSSSPHKIKEALVPACSLILELQTIVSRKIDANETAVISVTELECNGTRNTLPGTGIIKGDVRTLVTKVSNQVRDEIRKISKAIGLAHDLEVEFNYSNEFIPLINDPKLTSHTVEIVSKLFGKDKINGEISPILGSEDFARFLNHVPGSFVFIGNGEDSAPLHNPNYDFNDESLKSGTQYLVSLARSRLPATPS